MLQQNSCSFFLQKKELSFLQLLYLCLSNQLSKMSFYRLCREKKYCRNKNSIQHTISSLSLLVLSNFDYIRFIKVRYVKQYDSEKVWFLKIQTFFSFLLFLLKNLPLNDHLIHFQRKHRQHTQLHT